MIVSKKNRRLYVIILTIFLSIIMMLSYFFYRSRAESVKASIVLNISRTSGDIPARWIDLAQGGEEKGGMLKNITTQLSALSPAHIRLDHMYDNYDVVTRNSDNSLSFHWQKLDETVCDIYHAGAKPFFSLGYMPTVLSKDGSPISEPKDWNEWALLVQKTIEHYSGSQTRLCAQITGNWLKDIQYEVWNEPDLETFGHWSIYGGKDYRLLYKYAVIGAENAKDVQHFLIGGPATTALYQNWMQHFLTYVIDNNLRLDFLSWHHYSKDAEDFTNDVAQLNSFLTDEQYHRFQTLPRIISEWGYDSEPNPMADTPTGAAYTITAIRNFLRFTVADAFLFEAKDGPSPRWGILSYEGKPKPRYNALKLLTKLAGKWVNVTGEGTFIHALASNTQDKTTLILVNYDPVNKNVEAVPITVQELPSGTYSVTLTYLDGTETRLEDVIVSEGVITRSILLPPNMVVAVDILRKPGSGQRP